MSCLYIPIWFYSNYLGDAIAELNLIFTFQYGSTQMFKFFILISPFYNFTFQYGSTQMHQRVSWRLPQTTLHSNMVLLKLVQKQESRGLTSSFTFQYGSTQMVLAVVAGVVELALHSNMVLLKL